MNSTDFFVQKYVIVGTWGTSLSPGCMKEKMDPLVKNCIGFRGENWKNVVY